MGTYVRGGGATILHADADSFFASVEQRDDPRLLGRPVIVGGGVVLAASYEAKAFGVRTAMGGRQALRLCPAAVVVPPRMPAYVEASKALYAVFEDTSPLVEGLSIDEAFLDVRGMEKIAAPPSRSRAAPAGRPRAGRAPVTVGVARTKFLAKVASAAAKPDGLLLVPPEGEAAFLHPLPVEAMWGVGRRRRSRSATAGRDGRRPRADARAGARGDARPGGGTPSPRAREPPGFAPGRRSARGVARSARSTHGGAERTRPQIDDDLVALVDRVMRRVRAASRVGRTVVLRLRFDDFSRATRSHTLPHPTARTRVVLGAARELLAASQPLIRARGLTMIGVALDEPRRRPALPARAAVRSGRRSAARRGAGRDSRPLRHRGGDPRRSPRPARRPGDAPAA